VIAGQHSIGEAYGSSTTIMDATCLEVVEERPLRGEVNEYAWWVDLRIDAVLKGAFAEKEFTVTWREQRSDPCTDVVRSVVRAPAFWKKGSCYRLFCKGSQKSDMCDLLVAHHEEAAKAVTATVTYLVAELGRRDTDSVVHAAQILAGYGADAAPAIPELQKLLEHEDDAVRSAAREALRSLEAKDRPVLTDDAPTR
jgi:hypothetical protein